MPQITEAPYRIKPLSIVLARVPSTAGAANSVTMRATIKNPSRRLSCMFSIAFEADVTEVPNSYNSSTWTVRAMRKNRMTNRTGQMHLLVNGQALPNGYELDSAIRELLITATLAPPLRVDGTTVIPGNWVLLAEWEPNQPAMCEKEIEDLFGDCDVAVNGTEQTVSA